MINHEIDRGQQVQTQFSNHSTFHLPKVMRTDSGNYTCAPHNLRPASVFIHIIDEDSNSAAAAIHTAGENGENGESGAAMIAATASTGTKIYTIDIDKVLYITLVIKLLIYFRFFKKILF